MSLQPEQPAAQTADTASAPAATPAATPADVSKAPEPEAPAPTASEATEASNASDPPAFSWLDPHPEFVVVMVGSEEIPFGIQKNFLCAKSSYYREYFARQSEATAETVECVVKLPDCPIEVFAFAQNFLYTGAVFPNGVAMPSYENLIGVWKLGQELGVHGLCDHTLEAMQAVRNSTEEIPAPPLLVRAWKETPEGSSIRKLLLEWAAEYVRSSKSNAEFAKSLPQEVLSELVLAMSRSDISKVAAGGGSPDAPAQPRAQSQRKVVHYLDDGEEGEEPDPAAFVVPPKKQRRSDGLPNGSAAKAIARKPKTSATGKPVPRRRSSALANGDHEFTAEQKLVFCQDLLVRMLSGPGFWTRLVGPFREPVDPVVDNVPDYFEKVTKPMDLTTMKAKMDQNKYTTEDEFLADMNQIFVNCKSYWKPTDGIWAACEKLEKTFQDKYSQMNKWLTKMEGNEEH